VAQARKNHRLSAKNWAKAHEKIGTGSNWASLLRVVFEKPCAEVSRRQINLTDFSSDLPYASKAN
jgi:hypothetical protein